MILYIIYKDSKKQVLPESVQRDGIQLSTTEETTMETSVEPSESNV
jgi:hypothetical protein